MRKILEFFSREKILKRHLPNAFGADPIFVSPDAGLRFWSSNVEGYDPILFRICKEIVKPQSIVWDIGANFGLFSLPAAFLAGPTGRIVAIEPDTFSVELLKRSIKAGKNPRAKIDILPIAISNTVSISDFYIAKRGRATSFLEGSSGTTASGGIRDIHSVLTVTLDWLLNHLPPPSILKIDVECSEDRVLLGASKILQEIRPTIYCETTEGPIKTVLECFKKNDYIIYDIDAGLCQNVIALPKEHPRINYPLSMYMEK